MIVRPLHVRPLLRGLLTYVPAADSLLSRHAGHTGSAQYCYSVWLKHLCLLRAHGLQAVPDTVAELGPGESIGVGLAALLSGAEHYVGLDVVRHSDTQCNLQILDELVSLFRARTPRPEQHKGWPDVDGYLDERLFPGHILTPSLLARTLAPERVSRIREALIEAASANDAPVTDERAGGQVPAGAPTIRYRVPWSDPAVIEENSIDLVLSHSVLEHVVDLEGTYRALHAWLRPGAWTSHQIDLKSHGLTKEWDGYRACPEWQWKMMMGRRPYLINRQPGSVHIELIERAGLKIVAAMKHHRTDGIARARLTSRWADMSEDDLSCSGLYVLARK